MQKEKKIKKQVKKSSAKKKEQPAKEDSVRSIKIRVIGVGGGGGSIISNISGNLSKVSFYAVNTDVHALKEASKTKKVKSLSFGEKITNGLGTGMDKKRGREAAEENIEEVKKLFDDQDIVVFVTSLGGGTGSGATPYFAQKAKEMGCLVYGIFTLPFLLEGEKKMKIAKDAISDSISHLHAITVIPNEKIFEVVNKSTPLEEALSLINENLATGLGGLIETIHETGNINIDFADVRTVLENRKGSKKLTYISCIEADIEEGAQQIVKEATSNPLFPYRINKAKGILFNITGGKDLCLTDFASISESISEFTEDDAKIIIGSMQKQKLKNRVRISLLATGCETDFLKKELAEEEEKSNNKKNTQVNTLPKKKKSNSSKKEAKKKDKVEKKVKEEKKEPKEEDTNNRINVVRTKERGEEDRDRKYENPEELEIKKEEEKWNRPAFLKDE